MARKAKKAKKCACAKRGKHNKCVKRTKCKRGRK